ncbi:MAG: PQQ-binding-like beta-propeller repeat protein [Taibaiella sp.]|nr:PQQ-binding-like beta-propeller repeat protein [Taibaiella sp.]
MKIIYTLCLLLPAIVFAQKEDNTFYTEPITTHAGSATLHTNRIHFPFSVYKYYIDSNNNRLLLILRKEVKGKYKDEGYLALYDINTGALLWKNPMKSFEVLYNKNVTTMSAGGESYCFDNTTGKLLWHAQKTMEYVHPTINVGIATDTRKAEQQQGVDMTTGEKQWKYKPTPTTWADVKQLTDSTIIFTSEGLRALNLYSGEGWHYKAKIIEFDYADALLKSLLHPSFGLSVGFMGASIYIPIYENQHAVSEIITGFESDIVKDSNSRRIFFASHDKISCLGYEGNVVWETLYGGKHIFKPDVELVNNKVLLVNSGADEKKRNVTPFIALYDAATGKQEYMNEFNAHSVITGHVLSHDTMIVTTKSKVLKYLLADGEMIVEKPLSELDTVACNAITKTTTDKMWIKNGDGEYRCLSDVPAGNYIFYDINKNVIITNSQFVPYTSYSSQQYWFAEYKHGDILVIANNDHRIILKNNRFIAESNDEPVNQQASTKMVDVKNNEVDITDYSGL